MNISVDEVFLCFEVFLVWLGELILQSCDLVVESFRFFYLAGEVEEVLLCLQCAHAVLAWKVLHTLQSANDLQRLVEVVLVGVSTSEDEHELKLRLTLQMSSLFGECHFNSLVRVTQTTLTVGNEWQVVELTVHAHCGAQFALCQSVLTLTVGDETEGFTSDINARCLLGNPASMLECCCRVGLLQSVSGENMQADVLCMLLAQTAQALLVVWGEHGPFHTAWHLWLTWATSSVWVLRWVGNSAIGVAARTVGEGTVIVIAANDRTAGSLTVAVAVEALVELVGAEAGAVLRIAITAIVTTVEVVARALAITVETTVVAVTKATATTLTTIITTEATTIITTATEVATRALAITVKSTIITIAKTTATTLVAVITTEAAIITVYAAFTSETRATLIVLMGEMTRGVALATVCEWVIRLFCTAVTREATAETAARTAVALAGTVETTVVMIAKTTAATLTTVITTEAATIRAIITTVKGTTRALRTVRMLETVRTAAKATATTAMLVTLTKLTATKTAAGTLTAAIRATAKATAATAMLVRARRTRIRIMRIVIAHLLASRAARDFLPRRSKTKRPAKKSD